MNGDGFVDLIVGARAPVSTRTGAVRVLFLDANADVIDETVIGSGVGGFMGSLDVLDEFGAAVAPVGDLDGNGVPDVAVGAPGDDDAGANAGAVWILFLAQDGTVVSHLKITEQSGGFFGRLDPGDDFGRAIGVIGDVDGNGATDLAVGAPGDDEGGSNHGAIWILLMTSNSSGSVLGYEWLADNQGGFGGNLDAEDAFGFGVDGCGDINNDGTPDIVVGAPGDDDAGMDRGAAWVVFLDAAGSAVGMQKISDQAGGFTVALNDFDRFGTAIGALGDLDGNGLPEIGIGAPLDDDGGLDRGAVYVLALNSAAGQEGTVLDVAKITTSDINGVFGNTDQFGYSVAGIGDLDGNGMPEIAIGAPLFDEATNAGSVWIVYVSAVPFCGVGSVLDANDAPVDVLFLNGESGRYLGRDVSIEAGETMWATMIQPPAQGPGKYVVHANFDPPGNDKVTILPAMIGTSCFPMLLPSATPTAIWNNLGKTDLVGASRDFGGSSIPDPPRAPSLFAYYHDGDLEHLPPGTEFVLQGVITNPASLSAKGVSVTNAVFVTVE